MCLNYLLLNPACVSTALVEDIELAVWREKKKQKKVRNKKYYIGTFDTVDE